jgi:probable HAF family extracellular repeat protein
MRNRSCLVLALLLGWTATLSADVLHTVTDLGKLAGYYGTQGYGINNAGQVTGYSWIPGCCFDNDEYPTGFGAFLYSNGHMTDLGAVPGGDASLGFGINNAGQVTGTSRFYSPFIAHSRAFLYSNGHMTDLGTLGFENSNGNSINDAGQVTGNLCGYGDRNGFCDQYSFTNAFLYSNGHMTDLGPGVGNGINNAGQVTGRADTFADGFFVSHAFLYSDGHMTDLGTLPGFSESVGNGINNDGQVTGTSGDHAFLYSNGQMTDLGPGVGNGINNAGQVVGTSGGHAFLYSNGHMTDLNSLIEPGLGITITDARGINDKGQIVANGGNADAYLLTPVPEPSTLVLLGAPLLGALIWSRRRGGKVVLNI